MNKVVKNNWLSVYGSLFSIVCTGLILTACSKNPPAEEANQTASIESPQVPTTPPTGLVKNPVSHNKVADVTQWMDQASTKTATQIAQAEKLAREQKELRDKQLFEAKRPLENKALVAKNDAVITNSQVPATTPIKVPEAKAVEPAPVVVAGAPAPVIVASAPAQNIASASATTKPAPEAERIALKLVNNVQPKYPVSAVRAGITEGTVSARIHIDTDGKVSQVDILKARPSKVFEKEVIASLSQWKYAPITKPQTAILEFSFKSEQ